MSLFPFATTEDLTLADQEVTASSIREYEIDFEKGTLTGRIATGVDALCVWAYLALKAKRYRWIIYSWGYGDEVYDLIGYSYSEEYLKYYFRYMDDMVIFGSSKEELHKLKRELDEFMAVNLKQVLKHNWQVFPTKVRGVDFVGYRFFGEYTLLRKSTCKTFKRRMLSISSKRENNVSPTYSEWCSFNSYVGWLQHCDSFRLYQKYVEPNVEYMHNYYLKEVKGNAEICKRKNYSGERKAS